MRLQINLIAPPAYVVTTTSLDKEKGVELLRNALDAINKVISEKKGSMQIKFEPRAVTETDEKELTAMMEKWVANHSFSLRFSLFVSFSRCDHPVYNTRLCFL